MSKLAREENTIWVSVGITKNVGNYESVRLDGGMTVTVADGEDREKAWQDAWDEVDAQIEAKINELTEAG